MTDHHSLRTTERPFLELNTTSSARREHNPFSPVGNFARRDEHSEGRSRQFYDAVHDRTEPVAQRQDFRQSSASQDSMMQGRSPESVRTAGSQPTLPPFSALDFGLDRTHGKGSQQRSPTTFSAKSPMSARPDFPGPYAIRNANQPPYQSVYSGSSPASTQNMVSPERYMQTAPGQSPAQYERYRDGAGQTPLTDIRSPISAGTQSAFSPLSNDRSPATDSGSFRRGGQSPPLNNAASIGSVLFPCTHEDCADRPPFPTQYLLSSHQNVHKPDRPYYCPVKDCPRSDNGKPNSGFKRKNELIRHQLVHNSPGYACPFCPDRDHKYPRPDNLQRHVKVHHVEKSKDDPQLRAILSQRIDSDKSGRRRRVNSTT